MHTKAEISDQYIRLNEYGPVALKLKKPKSHPVQKEETDTSVISLHKEQAEAQNGNIEAFEKIYREYYSRLFFYGRKFIEDVEIVKDILQDTFYYVWEKREDIYISKSLEKYLLRTVHNKCVNHLKRSKLKDQYIADFKLKSTYNVEKRLDVENGQSKLIDEELRKVVQETIDSLAPQCKRIFLLSRVKGLKHKEIASKLSISTKTVETQIFRALKILRARLNKY